MHLKKYSFMVFAVLVISCGGMLTSCSLERGDGNYPLEGQLILSESGRPFLVCGNDSVEKQYVLLYDRTEDGSLFSNIPSGSVILIYGLLKNGDISSYANIYSSEITITEESQELTATDIIEVDYLDKLYSQREESTVE